MNSRTLTASPAATELPEGPRLSPSETTFQWLARPYAFLDECAARYGDAFTLHYTRFGTHVVVSHPDDVREVFTQDHDGLDAGRGNALLEPVLGRQSLLLVDGDRHLAQRAELQLAFRRDRVQRYAREIADAARRWTEGWTDGQTVSVQRSALEISKDVILRVALSVDESRRARLSRLIDRLMLLVGTNATFDAGDGDTRLLARFRAARAELDTALQEVIDARRARPDGDDVLATLLAAHPEPASDAEIRDQLITTLLAGHETTASSITWALLSLHQHPAALARLRPELDGAGDALPDEQLVGLPYLHAVCNETLRLRPVVPVVSRLLRRPLPVRGRTLPAGVFVTPSSYLAHRRPEVFPDPDEFRPERFLERRFTPYEYFPFGGGVRRCIGMSFALLELQIVLGTLLRRFDFEALEPIRPVRRAVTIVASGGGKMRVQRRRNLFTTETQSHREAPK